ncbi:uncharacterized protein LY89DRAFT_725372 [Mollisia scopiformis]|uniref:Uncharacterized protein n=1 Tax=Mollisia scopiformis TaxID=149040 RepID=A0A132B6K9_MOLSC|nr:uncharacterized protein LY89DRAFT_725372 [Mollisia scopiformis]KUJ08040.1 hypothetical protein LY89DRAFT_725372 [Mollisia scopiformis]
METLSLRQLEARLDRDIQDAGDAYGFNHAEFCSGTIKFGDQPGKTLMWFGDYKGDRFEKLDMGFRQRCILDRVTDDCEDLRKFDALHHAYNTWRDAKESPLTEKVWFGEYPLKRVIWRQKAKWEFRLEHANEENVRGMVEIKERYLRWRVLQQPRIEPTSTSRVTLNKMGRILGPIDDVPPSDDDKYDSDFVDKDSEPDPDSSFRPNSEEEDQTASSSCDKIPNIDHDLEDNHIDPHPSSSMETVPLIRDVKRRKIAIKQTQSPSASTRTALGNSSGNVRASSSKPRHSKAGPKEKGKRLAQSNTLKQICRITSSGREIHRPKGQTSIFQGADFDGPFSSSPLSVLSQASVREQPRKLESKVLSQAPNSPSSQEVLAVDIRWRARQKAL